MRSDARKRPAPVSVSPQADDVEALARTLAHCNGDFFSDGDDNDRQVYIGMARAFLASDWLAACIAAAEKAHGARMEAVLAAYVPIIKKQLKCATDEACGCTFCEMVEDLRPAIARGCPVATEMGHSAEKGLPADGTEVSVATRGMPGVFSGQRAVVRHQSPAGHSNIEHGMVWLECEVGWSYGTAQGFWASRSEYALPPGVGS